MAQIKLHHRLYEGLAYGPNNEIQFGPKGGAAPGYALVDEDDPMVSALLAEDADVEVVRDNGAPAQIFMCAEHPDREFKTKAGLLAHLNAKSHQAVDES